MFWLILGLVCIVCFGILYISIKWAIGKFIVIFSILLATILTAIIVFFIGAKIVNELPEGVKYPIFQSGSLYKKMIFRVLPETALMFTDKVIDLLYNLPHYYFNAKVECPEIKESHQEIIRQLENMDVEQILSIITANVNENNEF